jgi:hypothetical protein
VPVPGLCCLGKEASQRGMVSSRSRAVDLFQIERLTTSAAQRLGWTRAWQGGGRGEERKGEARSCAWLSILGRRKLHLDFTLTHSLSLSLFLSLSLHALLSERLTAGQFCLPPPVEYSKQRPRASFIFILSPCSSRPPRFQPSLFKSSKSPPLPTPNWPPRQIADSSLVSPKARGYCTLHKIAGVILQPLSSLRALHSPGDFLQGPAVNTARRRQVHLSPGHATVAATFL